MPHDVGQILEHAAPAVTSALFTASGTTPHRPTPTWSHPHATVAPHLHTMGDFGHAVAWVTFAIFSFAYLAFVFTALRKPKATRLFNWILVAMTFISAQAYYAMATGTGATLVEHGGHAYQVFPAHWIKWLLTSPLIVGTLTTLAGLPSMDTLVAVLCAAAGDVPSLIGALAYHGPESSRYHYKWGFIIFSVLPYLYVISTIVPARKAALARGTAVHRLYTALSVWEIAFYIPYPVILAFGAYTHVIPTHWEFLIFAILDVLTQVVFGAVLLYGLRQHPEAEVVLSDAWVGEPGSHGYEPVGREEPAT